MDFPVAVENKIREYMLILKEYSRKINIISKKITNEQLRDLVNESIILDEHITGTHIVDAGSGNGILGFPVAFLHPEKLIYLVEPRKKKSEFLKYTANKLKVSNVEVFREGIEDFTKKKEVKFSIIARGFPDNSKLISYLKKGVVDEVVLITSLDKIKKIEKGIVKYEQKIYNVPFRDKLKIIHITNVSRET